MNSGASKRSFSVIFFLVPVIIFSVNLCAGISPSLGEQVKEIISKMENTYAQIGGYQTETEINEYREGKVVEKKRFLYTFKKPNHVRIDMENPYPGMVLVYPGKDGKVSVKPGGWFGFLKLHLSSDNTLLMSNAGQRIDQTDMGLLIRNIAQSLTDRRHGEIKVSGLDGRTILEVLAEDHFLAGVITLYRFTIDNKSWLPMEVMEFTKDGILKRKVIFRNFRISNVTPESLFQIKGKESKA